MFKTIPLKQKDNPLVLKMIYLKTIFNLIQYIINKKYPDKLKTRVEKCQK